MGVMIAELIQTAGKQTDRMNFESSYYSRSKTRFVKGELRLSKNIIRKAIL